MATQSWSTVMDQTSDAAFRVWIAEFIAKLIAAGLVQTADTGQVNTATVVRPAINSNAGYAIFRMNDTQQGTAPVFFRIDFGAQGLITTPRIQVTVGTGTNGAGTLTGTALSTARSIISSNAPTSTVTAYQSYLCVTEGFFGIVWKVGLNSSNPLGGYAGFFFNRSVDAAGAASAEGCLIVWTSGSAAGFIAIQAMRYAATAAAFTAVTNPTQVPCVIPGYPTSSVVGSDNQAYLWWGNFPKVEPILGLCTIIRSEVNLAATFVATLVGSTPHTYMGMGTVCSGDPPPTPANGVAMLWE